MDRVSTRFFGLVKLFSIALLLGLFACQRQLQPPAELRIGLITALTGENGQSLGKSSTEAAQMFVQEINQSGGLKVGATQHQLVLLIEDDKSNPEDAVRAAQKLINQDNVVAIVGPYVSREAIPVAQVGDRAQIPIISPTSTNPQTTAGKKYVFRMVFTDEFQGQVMSQFARKELGAKKVAVLYDVASVYNRSIAEIFKQDFEQNGGQVVAFETYTTDTNKDFNRQLQRIQKNGADVLFLPNYAQEVELQARQARAVGIKATLLGSDTWDGLDLAKRQELEGAFFSTNYAPDPANPQNQKFIKAYQQRYQQEPDNVAALTYDTFGLLIQAIQAQGSLEPTAIRDGLNKIEQYKGVSGTAEYKGSGDPIKSAAIMQIKAGQEVFYKSVAP